MPAPTKAPLRGGEIRKRTGQESCSCCCHGTARAADEHQDAPTDDAQRHAATLRMLATIRERLPFVDRLTLFRAAALVGAAANPTLIDRDPGELASFASQLAEALTLAPPDERPGRRERRG